MAQLVERRVRNAKVTSSNLVISTKYRIASAIFFYNEIPHNKIVCATRLHELVYHD